MERVRLRLASGLIALLALLSAAAVARAQSERPKSVELVYRDYRDDGVIDACDHTKKALKKTLDQLPAEADIETPDLRPALEAGIEQLEQEECEPEPTPTPEPTATPAPVTPAPVTPAPAVTPPPVTTPSDPDSSNVAPLPGGGGGGGGNGGNDNQPGAGEVEPLPSETPAPAVTPVPPAEPTGPPAEPTKVFVNEDDGLPIPLIVLGGIAVLCALLALLYALLSRLGWADRALTPVRRSWREARFRAGGTWGDFADWMRLGR